VTLSVGLIVVYLCWAVWRWAVLGWQSLWVNLDTSRFDPNAEQLFCGCFWLWAKCEIADVL